LEWGCVACGEGAFSRRREVPRCRRGRGDARAELPPRLGLGSKIKRMVWLRRVRHGVRRGDSGVGWP